MKTTSVKTDQWYQDQETMVALVSLALQSAAKKLFQKGNLKNKRVILT